MMMQFLELTEYDIFKYVFFKKELDENKLRLIEDGNYFYEIGILKHIKERLSTNLSTEVKLQISEKISSYEAVNSIALRVIKKDIVNNSIKDEAGERNIPVSTATFSDADNIYLVRLVNYKSSSRVFVFSRIESLLKNYILVFKPTNEIFTQHENILSIEIDHVIDVDNIELKFF